MDLANVYWSAELRYKKYSGKGALPYINLGANLNTKTKGNWQIPVKYL